MVKVIGWLSPQDAYDNDEIMYEEVPYDTAHHEALVKELIDNNYIICGDTHQFSYIPLFEDGTLMLTQRSWGELMAQALNIKYCLNQKYKGMDFYMAGICHYKERFPTLLKK